MDNQDHHVGLPLPLQVIWFFMSSAHKSVILLRYLHLLHFHKFRVVRSPGSYSPFCARVTMILVGCFSFFCCAGYFRRSVLLDLLLDWVLSGIFFIFEKCVVPAAKKIIALVRSCSRIRLKKLEFHGFSVPNAMMLKILSDAGFIVSDILIFLVCTAAFVWLFQLVWFI